jgi:DNA polymerase
MIPTSSLDFETASESDLLKEGVHKYARDPTTRLTAIGFRIDGGERRLWLPGDEPPDDLFDAIAEGVVFKAWNAQFEMEIWRRVCHERMGWPTFPDGQWSCTQARALVLALPATLERAAIVLGARVQKDKAGHALMKLLCRPRNWKELAAYDKSGTGAPRPAPDWSHHTREALERQGAYCLTDIDAEDAVSELIPMLSPREQQVWDTHQRIMRRGICIDMEFVTAAIGRLAEANERLNAELTQLTNGRVSKITAVPAMKQWLMQTGYELEQEKDASDAGVTAEDDAAEREYKLDARSIVRYLSDPLLPANVRRVLEIRQEAGRSSVSKLESIRRGTETDDHIRGTVIYHRASTGRFAGARLQPHNFVRAGLQGYSFDEARRDIVCLPEREFASPLNYGSTHTTLSKMVRGSIIAAPGCKLIWADYAAIEARGTPWLSDEHRTLELFATNAPIYEVMASHIFGREITRKDEDERFIGKQTVLGCGYGMGPTKFMAHCERLGHPVTRELAERGVYGWREVNSRTVAYWKELEAAAVAAILNGRGDVFRAGKIAFRCESGWLQMRLPSRRTLWYKDAHLEIDERFGTPRIAFHGLNGVTKQWQKETTWGGKLLENAVQAICRDLLVDAIDRLEYAGYPVVLHVHDEIVGQPLDDHGSADEFGALMAQSSDWAPGFPIKVETKEGYRYGK